MNRFLCTCIAGLFGAGLPLFGATLLDFQKEKTLFNLNLREARGQTLRHTDDSLKVTWDARKFLYAELNGRKDLKIPDFKKAEFSVVVRIPSGCPLRKFNLRLEDASGEVFQWERAGDWSKGGTYTIVYAVTPENANLAWSGNRNRKLDFPVRFRGFSMDFPRKGGAGTMEILSAKYLTSSGKTAMVSSRETVDLMSLPFSVYRGPRYGQSLKSGKEGLVLTWSPDRNFYLEAVCGSGIPLPYFKRGKIRVELTVSEKSASLRDFNLRMADSTGKTFQWPKKVDWKNPGKQVLEYEVTPPNSGVSWGGAPGAGIRFPVRFTGFTADYRKSPGPGELEVHAIRADFEAETPLVQAVDFSLKTGNPFSILNPESADRPRLVFQNRVNAEVTVRAGVRFRDFYQKEFAEEHCLTFRPHESREIVPKAKFPHPGFWNVTARIARPEEESDYQDISRSVAYMKPAGESAFGTSGFLFGICSHPNWTLDRTIYEREAEAMALCGAKVMRMDIEWRQIERTPGVFDYSRYDAIVDAFSKRGIELEAILNKTPEWAAVKGNLPDSEAWRTFIRKTLAHYHKKIRLWEVWNEPDLRGFATFTVPEYVNLMKIVREEASALDPSMKILSGGFATIGRPDFQKPHFHENTLAVSHGLFDYHAFHEHGEFQAYSDCIDHVFLPARRKYNVTVPWYSNETAITAADGREHVQAVTLYKKMLFAWSRNAVGYNWYNLRNKGNDPKDGEHNFGLLTQDFEPKPAYVVYNMLATHFKGKTYARQFRAGEGLWIFEFRGKDEILIPCWNENFNFGADSRLLVRTDARQAEWIDLTGSVQPVQKIHDAVLLTVSRTPRTLRLRGGSKLEFLPAPIGIQPPPLLIPGERQALTLKIQNPFSTDSTCRLRIVPPEGLIFSNLPESVRLKPGEGKTLSIPYLVARNYSLPFNASDVLTCEYQIDGTEFRDAMRIPLYTATLLPATFRLNRKSQTVSLFDADPTNLHRVWRDANDLSVSAVLDSDGTNLILDVNVTDDVHVQKFSRGGIWKGDSVQAVVQLPNQTGMWEFGFSLSEKGVPEVWTWKAPEKMSPESLTPGISLKVSRKGSETVYRAVIPMKPLGLTPELLRTGFRFNLLVNDDDGFGRDGWIQIAPGIGTHKNSDEYPFVLKK